MATGPQHSTQLLRNQLGVALREEAATELEVGDLIDDKALESSANDQFDHRAIARRVSELVSNVNPPANIALFGAWGTGKSSLKGLIQEDLETRRKGVKFISYDAWRLGGHSLRRNFITNAAESLQLHRGRHRKFYEGLYESKRSAELHLGRLTRELLRLGIRFLALAAVIAAVLAGLIGATSWISSAQDSFGGEIEQHFGEYIRPALIAALVAALFKALLDVGRVDIEQKAPSEEDEFSGTFRELIAAARSKPLHPSIIDEFREWRRWVFRAEEIEPGDRPYDRLVFFIDELDRLPRKDVVETLVAIRTFLDEKHCVFVVAADRAVLEEALDSDVPQETPINEDAPYFSTAGAFLDKIFQHQIALPPLRGRRLTRFARDLVAGRQHGVWSELAAVGVATLDQVVYTLVPAHIRSPRRVKVLLNNFATNARIAQSRGIAWVDRAEELAKLTALQTEFPTLAGDLPLEPRLPNFLLDPPERMSQRMTDLVKRHALDSEGDREVFLPDRRDPDEEPESRAAQVRADRAKEMRRTYNAQLRRYLERTASVPPLRRDLFYLEAAGAAVGLDDPELGDFIEEEAPEKPNSVIHSLLNRELSERLGATRLLASMVHDLLSTEQENVVTAMLALAAQLGDELDPVATAEAANALRTFRVDESREQAAHQLPGALRIALNAGDPELTLNILEVDDLWSDPERLIAIIPMGSQLPPRYQAKLRTRIAEELPSAADVVREPARTLPEAQAVELLESEEIREGVREWAPSWGDLEDNEEASAFVADLLDAALRPGPENG